MFRQSVFWRHDDTNMMLWRFTSTDRQCLRLDSHKAAKLLVAVLLSALATPGQPADVAGLSSSPWQAQIDSLAAVENELRAPAAPNVMAPAICVVVRTFWGHGGKNMDERQEGLRSLLASLRAQQNPRHVVASVLTRASEYGMHIMLLLLSREAAE